MKIKGYKKLFAIQNQHAKQHKLKCKILKIVGNIISITAMLFDFIC